MSAVLAGVAGGKRPLCSVDDPADALAGFFAGGCFTGSMPIGAPAAGCGGLNRSSVLRGGSLHGALCAEPAPLLAAINEDGGALTES